MKLMTNFISATLLASSLTAFNVPAVLANDVTQISMTKAMSAQDVIKSTFADFTIAVHTSPVENKDIILRQALTEASKSFQSHNISQKDLVEYATADMNPAEAKAFKAQVSALVASDLQSSEGQMLLEKILVSQSKGSNFLPCGAGFFLAVFAGTGAIIMAILALTSAEDVSRVERQDLEKDRAAIQSEISILQGEGVSNDSYLITSRRAELVQIDIQTRQLLEDKEKNSKNSVTMGAIAGGLTVVTIVGAVSESSCN